MSAGLRVERDVRGLLAHAQANGRVVIVYGSAGAGKTTAAGAHRDDAANCWIATMSPAITTPSAVLARVADVLDVGIHGPPSAARLEAAVTGALLAVERPLLVVDEAHQLTPALLDQLRCVHDATGCGLALLGNEPLWGRLAAGERSAQLASRVALRRRLRGRSDADALALAASLVGFDPEDGAREAVLAAGRHPEVGALRAVAMLCERAALLARGADRDVEPGDLVDAARLRGGA